MIWGVCSKFYNYLVNESPDKSSLKNILSISSIAGKFSITIDPISIMTGNPGNIILKENRKFLIFENYFYKPASDVR